MNLLWEMLADHSIHHRYIINFVYLASVNILCHSTLSLSLSHKSCLIFSQTAMISVMTLQST